MPTPRALLLGVLGFRLFLCVLLLSLGAVLWAEEPDTAFSLAIGVLVVLFLTAHAGYTRLIRRDPTQSVWLFLQSLIDLTLVTTLVYLGGESATALAALYVVVITGYAVLLPVGGGVGVAVLASGAYLAEALLGPGDLPPGLFGQIVVFIFVFLLVAAVGLRLRDTAAHQTRLESELHQARLEATEILRSIRAGVLTVDGDGRLGYVNPPAARLLGLDDAGVLGFPVLELLARRAPELHDAIVAGLRSGVRVGRGEGTVHPAAGRPFPIGLSTTTFDRNGGQTAVTAVFTDLSELKELQELQFRAERLEAVAAMSASLAHEIRNPLASIRSSVEQLAATAQASEDERVLGKLILRESDRLTRLLSEFLDFSRVRAVNFSSVDLLEVATQAIALVREHPDCGADVRILLEGSSATVQADEDLLHRMVSNLVLNAVQACRGAGTVRVSVARAEESELPPGLGMENPVRLVVEDDGLGVDHDLRERLFQPFVSGRSGGSGLGLAIVQRAAEAHRGLVLLDSEPGEGARFTVYLRPRPFEQGVA